MTDSKRAREIHRCHAIECNTKTQPELLMCAKHWTMVPKDIQNLVYKNYRKGQCSGERPSNEWLKAARKAITFVAHKEGRLSILREAE